MCIKTYNKVSMNNVCEQKLRIEFILLKVVSMVALIYNTFTVYLPTAAEKEEGFLPDPAMCQTTR